MNLSSKFVKSSLRRRKTIQRYCKKVTKNLVLVKRALGKFSSAKKNEEKKRLRQTKC